VEHTFCKEELRALDTVCAQASVTRFMVLLAAFGVVLSYYSGDEDLVVGVPMSNRDTPEQINVVSFLLNMLPLRLCRGMTAQPGPILRPFGTQ
jgi:non-ribosomal peptide synthetase component F